MCESFTADVLSGLLTCNRALGSRHVRRESKVSTSMRLSATDLYESCD
jgi:hypothetical protein